MQRSVSVSLLVGALMLGHEAVAQPPSGDTSAVFLPGVVSTGREFTVSFSSDGMELYFTRSNTESRTLRVMRSVRVNGSWSAADPVALGSTEWSDLDPALSPDGQRLYFASTRPRPGRTPGQAVDMDLWFATRTPAGWSEPQWMEAMSSDGKEGSPAVDRAGNVCFFSDRGNQPNQNAIYCARALPNGWASPARLAGGVNDGPSNTSPWLSPDGKTLLFYSTRDGGIGKADLYFSELVSGQWTPPASLGPRVNTRESEVNPSVSTDGRTLYFGRRGRVFSIPLASLGIAALTPERLTR
jgi:Tol biopolymer transport system component